MKLLLKNLKRLKTRYIPITHKKSPPAIKWRVSFFARIITGAVDGVIKMWGVAGINLGANLTSGGCVCHTLIGVSAMLRATD
jgi:hypothetical protein